MGRILLKLSGEALAGDKHHGFDEPTVTEVAKQVKQLVDKGTEVGIVIGGVISGGEEPVRLLTGQRLTRLACLLQL